jgi:hypothetical protein
MVGIAWNDGHSKVFLTAGVKDHVDWNMLFHLLCGYSAYCVVVSHAKNTAPLVCDFFRIEQLNVDHPAFSA